MASDIRRWALLSTLNRNFAERIKEVVVFGSAGSEAILLTDDDEVYALGTSFCAPLGCVVSAQGGGGVSTSNAFLEPQRIAELCGRQVQAVVAGCGPHVLALDGDGRVWAWGQNSHGQLGRGDTSYSDVPQQIGEPLASQRVVALAAGGHHSIAVTEQGALYTWGANSAGQLGLGHATNSSTPQLVTALVGQRVQLAAAGNNFTLALTDDGKVYAFGANSYGQTGTGELLGNQNRPQLLDELAKETVVSKVACGYAHSLALSDGGALWVWGANSCGQLGANVKKNQLRPAKAHNVVGRVADIHAAHFCNITVVTDQHGKVWMWGHLRGQSMGTPVQTPFTAAQDAFACFASPPVSPGPLRFEVEREAGLVSVLRLALDDPNTSDLKIRVDGHTIHAHKSLLRLRSDYFRTRFGDNWAESRESEIEIAHFSHATVLAFLRWLYTDELGGAAVRDAHEAVDVLAELLDLADCYCEPNLKKQVGRLLEHSLSVRTAPAIYATAIQHRAGDLEKKALAFCMNHLAEIVKAGDAFQALDAAALRQLVTHAAERIHKLSATSPSLSPKLSTR